MRICVCGLGKVGRPILQMLRTKGIEAVGYDIDPKLSELSAVDAVKKSDAAIFIVPTPSLPDGAFSNVYLYAALQQFKRNADAQKKSDYLYIVSSTTVPGSCEGFRSMVGDNIVYKPEFIRLEHVQLDLVSTMYVLIGSASQEAGDRCEKLYRKLYSAPVARMSLTEAELAKITLNCALTMKISLANQLHLVAEKMGCDSKKIMGLVSLDPRIGGAYLEPGRPYEGPCLPRDNRMFRYVAKKLGVNAALSKGADEINEVMEWKCGVKK